GGVIVSQLASLQIIHHGFYRALAQGQQQKNSFQMGERGNIYAQDKQGRLVTLATTHDVAFLFASPPDVQNPEETATQVSEIMGRSQEEILSLLQQPNSLFSLITRSLTLEQEEAIQSLNLPGIHVGKETKRLYPQLSLASHILGFTNQDGVGQYGLEAHYQDILQGREELLDVTRSPARYLRSAFSVAPKKGASMVLTIDAGIQSFIEAVLDQSVANLNAKEGSIIVMDPFTGKILALAVSPRFNPNEYAQVSDFSLFINPTIQNLYEPGSVMKAFTMAAAIDKGAISPDTTYRDTGNVRIGGRTISNFDKRSFGEQNMREVLRFSINTGAVFAQQQLGNAAFLEYMERFGVFERTGIDLAGETFSQNTEFKKGYEINFATASFGQGVDMTAMQVARMYSVFANGGFLVQPYVVEKIIQNGKEELVKRQTTTHAVLSPRASVQITQMLEHSVGMRARILGYKLAGKTGTSQIAWSALGVQRSGYSDQTIQSYVGYGPTSNPQFVVFVSLVNPQTRTAEHSAAPLFREIAQYILDYYEIPPDAD
ncbi:MAG: penicillin-binding protein 2, partial [bacterium]|nr:penicillin-binding protein 2 [bacterium]